MRFLTKTGTIDNDPEIKLKGRIISNEGWGQTTGLYYKHCYAPRVVIYDSKVPFNLQCTLRL